MGGIYEIDGIVPVIEASTFVHPDAVVIGDVHVGGNCYIGPCASIRGDFGRIVIHAGSNVQDSCVLHTFPQKNLIIEEEGHIGHGAVLHGCIIKRNVLVGMNSVIMDDAVIGAHSLVAAMSFVKSGLHVPEKTLISGSPARVVRELRDEEVSWKINGARVYQQLAQRSLHTLKPAEPLTEMNEEREQQTNNYYDATALHILKQAERLENES